MNEKEELKVLRVKIDKIDEGLIGLFQERLRVCERIADVKAAGNIAIVDSARESEKVATVVNHEDSRAIVPYLRSIMALCTIRQREKLLPGHDILFPQSGMRKTQDIKVGYQGVIGAWGEQGAKKIFPEASMQNFDYFEDVFIAVKKGEVDYGILPIENSQTGAIGEVYDLLRTNGCFIVGQTVIPIAHCLLGKKDAVLSDVREVLSHPEGFRQCHKFLRDKSWDITTSRNTAVAAQTVAERDDKRSAAIGSERAAEIYGLSVLAKDIVDNPHNQTRFIAIANQPIYDEESGMISATFSTKNISGALCTVLQTFMLAGINLTRIESRPVTENTYRFFTDLQANVMDERVLEALRQASAQCDYFEILGCY